jgi:hypothetical protein
MSMARYMFSSQATGQGSTRPSNPRDFQCVPYSLVAESRDSIKDTNQLLYNFSIFLGALLMALAHPMLEGQIIVIKIKLEVSLFDTILFTK